MNLIVLGHRIVNLDTVKLITSSRPGVEPIIPRNGDGYGVLVKFVDGTDQRFEGADGAALWKRCCDIAEGAEVSR